jgi:N,N'-diacetyllegionaminate synthase
MYDIALGEKLIGKTHPCFVIAEAGINHNGQLKLAFQLIEIAKKAGADAIKFQLFSVEEMVSSNSENAPYQKKGSGENTMDEMAKHYDLSWKKHIDLAGYCEKVGILYMSSCFDPNAVDYYVNNLGGICHKIASGELTNYPLLTYMAKSKIPIILSTGMADLSDVDGAINQIQNAGNNSIILLHCVSSYPAYPSEINLKAMNTLAKKFNLLVGYSDHTIGNDAAIAAVALGAVIIEKHFTIDKSLHGPDHSMSLSPKELKGFIMAIHKTKKLMGDGVKRATPAEIEMQKYARRGVVAKTDIKTGEVINESMLTLKRPAIGIDPRSMGEIVGKIAQNDIMKDFPINWDDIV